MSLIAAKSLVQRSVDNMNLRPLSLTPDWWLAIVKAYNGHVPKTTGLPKRTDQSKTLHPYCLLQWLPAAPHLSSLFLKNHKTSNASHVVHFYTITIQQMARSLLVPELHNLCTLPASKCNLFFLFWNGWKRCTVVHFGLHIKVFLKTNKWKKHYPITMAKPSHNNFLNFPAE